MIFLFTHSLQPQGINKSIGNKDISDHLFPLCIGNKWYYQAGSNRNECYGIIKEITDTITNGFREITCHNLFRTYISITKEYWGDIDNKFINDTYPEINEYRIFYDNNIIHDSCISSPPAPSTWRTCWQPLEYTAFNVSDTAQKYIYQTSSHIGNIYTQTIAIVLPKIGIVRTWNSYEKQFYYTYLDSSILIGMYKNGEFLGDSVFANPYRASCPVSPWNNSREMLGTVILQWKKALGVISYKLQVSKDTSFNNLVFEYKELKDTFQVIGPLERLTTYYWRICTLSDDGKEYWSPSFNFMTMIIFTDSDKSLTEYELCQNYPNPFNLTTKIKYSVPSLVYDLYSYKFIENIKSQINLKVYNMLGEEIATLVNEEKPAGSFEVMFDASSLPSGIYFYKLQTENFSSVKKMILMK